MIITYRQFQEQNGQHTIREVFYERDGQMITYSASPITPIGGSLSELTQELAWMAEALAAPVLTLAEVDAEIVKQPARPRHKGPTISHEELVAKLGLTLENEPEAEALVGSSTGD